MTLFFFRGDNQVLHTSKRLKFHKNTHFSYNHKKQCMHLKNMTIHKLLHFNTLDKVDKYDFVWFANFATYHDGITLCYLEEIQYFECLLFVHFNSNHI